MHALFLIVHYCHLLYLTPMLKRYILTIFSLLGCCQLFLSFPSPTYTISFQPSLSQTFFHDYWRHAKQINNWQRFYTFKSYYKLIYLVHSKNIAIVIPYCAFYFVLKTYNYFLHYTLNSYLLVQIILKYNKFMLLRTEAPNNIIYSMSIFSFRLPLFRVPQFSILPSSSNNKFSPTIPYIISNISYQHCIITSYLY